MRFATRLTVTAAVAVAVALLVALVGVYVVTARALVGTVDRALTDLAADLAAGSDRPDGGSPGGPGGHRDPYGGPGFVEGRLDRYGAYAQVVTADGEVVGTGTGGQELAPTDRAVAVAQGGDADRETLEVDGVRLRTLTVPAGDGMALQLARPLAEVDDALSLLRGRLVAGGLLGTVLAIGLGALTSRRATRPVRALTDLAEQVTATGDLSRRIDPAGDDELARLGRTIDRMLASVEEARTAQEQLVADASHELRTPLASLRTNAEVLASADRLAPADRRALVADVVGQLDEVTTLVDDLVELARGARPSGPDAGPVRLDEVARRAVERLRGVTGDRTIRLELVPTTVHGDAVRLERVVTNIVVNALRHGDGTVEVVVADGRLEVRDHGSGFAADDLEHVFDRFYRADSARGTEGSGLGLAIVRQTVLAHDGTVTAANAPDGGAVVEVALPSSA